MTYWLGGKGLSSPFVLKAIFWINALGTVYGYYWYWGQLKYTWSYYPQWMVILVPDSPTASLFFTIAIGWLWKEPERRLSSPGVRGLRGVIEAFAVVTSVKYGFWAVTMIFAGAAKGDTLIWQDYMLVLSHLGMALEGLLYARFFRISMASLAVVGVWTLCNDLFDYGAGIYPWLPDELDNELAVIQMFTTALSLFSLAAARAVSGRFLKHAV